MMRSNIKEHVRPGACQAINRYSHSDLILACSLYFFLDKNNPNQNKTKKNPNKQTKNKNKKKKKNQTRVPGFLPCERHS
jgi:hypothetical protein